MKRLTTLAVTAAALTALLASCTSDFDIDDEGPELLVVNILARPDAILTADITHTWPHSDWSHEDVAVADADVSLTVNGMPMGAMTYDPALRRYVMPGFTPTEGDSIMVRAVAPHYGEASGATRVPRKVAIDRWSFEPVEVTDYHGIVVEGDQTHYLSTLQIRYSITFTDPAGEDNYYLVSGRPHHETGGGTCSDPILSENDTPLDAVFNTNKSFVVFSDRSIDGRTYTLSYTCTYTPYIPIQEFAKGRLTDRISLCSISREYYLYLLSIYKKYGDLNSNLEDMGLTEPRIIYSNVNPGVGVVASQSADTLANDVHDIVCEWLGYDPLRPDE